MNKLKIVTFLLVTILVTGVSKADWAPSAIGELIENRKVLDNVIASSNQKIDKALNTFSILFNFKSQYKGENKDWGNRKATENETKYGVMSFIAQTLAEAATVIATKQNAEILEDLRNILEIANAMKGKDNALSKHLAISAEIAKGGMKKIKLFKKGSTILKILDSFTTNDKNIDAYVENLLNDPKGEKYFKMAKILNISLREDQKDTFEKSDFYKYKLANSLELDPQICDDITRYTHSIPYAASSASYHFDMADLTDKRVSKYAESIDACADSLVDSNINFYNFSDKFLAKLFGNNASVTARKVYKQYIKLRTTDNKTNLITNDFKKADASISQIEFPEGVYDGNFKFVTFKIKDINKTPKNTFFKNLGHIKKVKKAYLEFYLSTDNKDDILKAIDTVLSEATSNMEVRFFTKIDLRDYYKGMKPGTFKSDGKEYLYFSKYGKNIHYGATSETTTLFDSPWAKDGSKSYYMISFIQLKDDEHKITKRHR